MTAAPANRAAEPAGEVSPLTAAYTAFVLAIVSAKNRPRPLRAINSYGALEDRVCAVEAQILACREWLKALLEDTAQHLPLAGRLDDVVEAAMGDMASDVRGRLVRALEERMS